MKLANQVNKKSSAVEDHRYDGQVLGSEAHGGQNESQEGKDHQVGMQAQLQMIGMTEFILEIK